MAYPSQVSGSAGLETHLSSRVERPTKDPLYDFFYGCYGPVFQHFMTRFSLLMPHKKGYIKLFCSQEMRVGRPQN